MHILIDPGSYDCLNMGDAAMLQVAIARLRALLPEATLQVLTDDPAALEFLCPGVIPLSHGGRMTWVSDEVPLGPLRAVVPGWAKKGLAAFKRAARHRWPARLAPITRLTSRRTGVTGLSDFLEAMRATDLYLVCGQGTLADAARTHAISTLRTAALAIGLRKPVVMLGQGIGRMRDPELSALAREVLPAVRFVAVREGRTARPVLRAMGVAPGRVLVTGDDAIEMAYAAPEQAPRGQGIGVHVRRAPQAIADEALLDRLRLLIQQYAAAFHAPLLPLPISRHHTGTNDVRTIRAFLAGYHDQSDGGDQLDTPLKVIRQVASCRVVITGAYHAAVFALAQGIPAVCYAQSVYYLEKFHGLAQQFGSGCYVVPLGAAQMPQELTSAVHDAWRRADELHEPLRQAALRQIASGRSAYQELLRVLGAAAASAPAFPPLPNRVVVRPPASDGLTADDRLSITERIAPLIQGDTAPGDRSHAAP